MIPKFTQKRDAHDSGLTRIELCAVLTVVGLLLAVAWPVLATTRAQADRLVCISNLGEIGQGYNRWAADHGDRYPFILSAADGGIRYPYNGLEGNAWFQFAWISNELVNARVLACPADSAKHAVDDFSFRSNGLLHPTNRNNSISYFVSFSGLPDGTWMLSGDRNLRGDDVVSSSSIFGTCYRMTHFSSPYWDDRLHRRFGNLLLCDGSVASIGSPELKVYTSVERTFNGLIERVMP